jgi:poly(3-hydroxyalkanoate) synthetase
MDLEKLKYPVGKFQMPAAITRKNLENYFSVIADFPGKLEKEVIHLSDAQLDTPYRPGGWTVRQVVHHCADSHINSLTRLKLTLTEENPTVKPYFEERWAELSDGKIMPVSASLKMIEGIHARWVFLLRSLTDEQYKRSFIHPEHGKKFRLDENTALYAWHCDHHLAHITELKKREGWT